jgi:multicomponent Na+:H+ antiporter subunit D
LKRPSAFQDWFLRLLPVASLTILTLAIGLLAEPIMDLSMRASEQLMNPSAYIESVMGVVQQAHLPYVPQQ